MSIIFDIIAVALILTCAISSLKNGFIPTLIKKTAPLVSVIAAFSGARTIAPRFSAIADKVTPGASAENANEAVSFAARPLHAIIEYVIAFVVIFAVSMLVLWLLALIFKILNNIVNKIPGLSLANKIVGVILGVLVGYFNANFFVYVVSFVGAFVDSVGSALSSTAVCKFIMSHSIFEAVAEKIASLF